MSWLRVFLGTEPEPLFIKFRHFPPANFARCLRWFPARAILYV